MNFFFCESEERGASGRRKKTKENKRKQLMNKERRKSAVKNKTKQTNKVQIKLKINYLKAHN
jgi:hypothetical protein